MKEKQTLRPFGWKDKIGYMMGDVGSNLVLSMANSYLLVFYTKVMGVSAGIIGTIFMLARFVDAFTDVAVGRMVDTKSDKNGERFRPWIAYFSVPLVIASCSMYNYFLAGASMTVKIIYLIVTYILFGSVFYTAVNIPYGAMSAVITNDPQERASLSTWRNLGAQFGGLLLGILIPMIVYVKDADGNQIASGPRFFWLAVVLGLLALGALLWCRSWSVERIKLKNKTGDDGKENTSFKVILEVFKDKTLLMNFGYSIFIYAAMQVFMTFNQYMFLDYFGNPTMSGLASLVMFAGTLLSAPFATKLGPKIGKKEISVVGLALSTAAYLIMFLFKVTNPVIYFLWIFVAFFGVGLMSMICFALTNDCIDNHYLETGVRAEGTVYAVNSFVRKLAAAVCNGIGGWGLAAIGYQELAAVQTEEVRQSLYTLAIGLTLACFALTLLFLILFPLNKKKIDENTRRLAEMNKE